MHLPTRYVRHVFMRIWHPSSAALSKLLPQGRVGPKVFLEANKNTKNGEYASDMLRRASTSVSNWSGDLLRPGHVQVMFPTFPDQIVPTCERHRLQDIIEHSWSVGLGCSFVGIAPFAQPLRVALSTAEANIEHLRKGPEIITSLRVNQTHQQTLMKTEQDSMRPWLLTQGLKDL